MLKPLSDEGRHMSREGGGAPDSVCQQRARGHPQLGQPGGLAALSQSQRALQRDAAAR